jgi:hypothetical protein
MLQLIKELKEIQKHVSPSNQPKNRFLLVQREFPDEACDRGEA